MSKQLLCRKSCFGCASKKGHLCRILTHHIYDTIEHKQCPFYITLEQVKDDLIKCYNRFGFKYYASYNDYILSLENQFKDGYFLQFLEG